MIQSLPLLPRAASTIAGNVDALFSYILGVSLFFATLIAVLIVVFAIRYRRRPGRELAPSSAGNLPLEIGWMVVPLAIAMTMFVWGASVFVAMRSPPDNSLQVYVVGRRWMWKVQHVEGKREIDSLHVPVGRPVKLTMTSEDVIHSFYIPAFRLKQDAVPGRYTILWFEATKAGRYHLFCAEYCGTQHSRMIGDIVALEPAEYQAWLAGESAPGAGTVSMVDAGQDLFNQLGCATCHKMDGEGRGPILAGVPGSHVALANGATVVADDSYLRESILDPQAKVTRGFQPIMPTYKGLVSEDQLLQLIEYIKSLQPPARVAQAAQGAQPAAARE
ncbi:MAG TPA: cytochrome c oxidase subunit II [Candidatus Binatia bacterium]|nr:cytochrome c oxidase subunit II [Candidatus Binatia bacterium]